MLRAVLDTNVLVSGLISPSGIPAQLISAWREKKFELVISPAILQELAEVLQRDKMKQYYEHIDRDLARKYVAGLKRFATLAPGKVQIQGVCPDPNDDKFVAAALESRADYIVSGDNHLLNLKEYEGVKILRPAEFFARL
ncbi:MAG TPA: putative toxin-antitoxin system toxin component, PIN family [Firmicutes bacterium]|nr:putative toxin-antitoxin system toxin component, PIN family [Candidatus Fermentithermobacillaceae bacterium]